MDNKRSTKNQPFCWQEKKILRLLRCRYEGKEHDKLRNLYLTLTEIYSDFNGKDIKYYTQTIIKYSSLSKEWIPKGLKIFENLKVIQLVEERNKGKFKGKRLIFTPENIEEMEKFTNEQKISDENTITDKTVPEFLEPSEDSLYLEDNKRIEDINNTHTGEDKKVHDKLKQEEELEKDKLSDTPMEIQDILKKYRDLGLPDFKYPPENHIILRVYRELGIAKLYEALTLMAQSEFVKNNMSINAIFKIENLKKALNGNFKDKANRTKNTYENKKEFERPAYENTTGDFIKDLLNGANGGK
ncbi:hypothetical protein [Fusobacterium ulcerans]|uniref:hypothetical protein n=1 Tax=Fusobacterium ulcerans TaxID=861 RepID=UPI001032C3EE|nr:hypothetical protein [Fusobacterium ulcerans]